MTNKYFARIALLLLTYTIIRLNSPVSVRADDFYVAVNGDDGTLGTEQEPFATVERAETAASPGDTVYIRGGTYRFRGIQRTVGVAFTKSGQPDRPIRYFAYPGELPIFDLSEVTPMARVTGFDIQSDWIHIRGLEVTRVRQLIVGDSWGVRIRGSHNVLEALNVHHCEAPGIFITSGSDNQIVNCDSHHNYDPLENGGNADGFGCHSSGGDNVFRSCRGFENSDDGFDFINAPGTCIVEYSWAFHNGFVPDTSIASGNGAGFKSGGFGNPPNIPITGVPRHVVHFNLAFDNRAQGFYANHHPGGIDFISNTAFDNAANFDMRVTGAISTHLLRNNLAGLSGVALTNFTGGSDEFNSWTLPVSVTNEDFNSLDKTEATRPRAADGSLPQIELAHLRDDSDLVDCGEDRGFPFAGTAPDLGAFESGLLPPTEESVDAGDETQTDAGSELLDAAIDGAINGEPGPFRNDAAAFGNPLDTSSSDTGPESGQSQGQDTPPVPEAGMTPAGAAGTAPVPASWGTGSESTTSSCGCQLAIRHSGKGAVLSFLLCLLVLARRIRFREKALQSKRSAPV